MSSLPPVSAIVAELDLLADDEPVDVNKRMQEKGYQLCDYLLGTRRLCSKFYLLCLIFIPQFPFFANKLALLWVNSKYLKLRL